MTLHYSELEQFMKYVKEQGFLTEISDNELRRCIAKRFDIASDYTITSIKKALHEFGFIKQLTFNRWGIAGMGTEKKDEESLIDKVIDSAVEKKD